MVATDAPPSQAAPQDPVRGDPWLIARNQRFVILVAVLYTLSVAPQTHHHCELVSAGETNI